MDTIISGNESILYVIKNISIDEYGNVSPKELYDLLNKIQKENKDDKE